MRCGVGPEGTPFITRLSRSFTAGAEKFAEQLYGFGLQDAAIDVDGVIEAGIGGDIVEGACVAGFRVGGGVD